MPDLNRSLGFFGGIGVFLSLILRLGGGADRSGAIPTSPSGTVTADITSVGRTP